jgi:hypothetical protein
MSKSAITSEVLGGFVGGQLEVQDPDDECLYRGEIAQVDLRGEGDEERVTVTFEWLAKAADGGWIVTENQPWTRLSLMYSASLIDGGRLLMQSPFTGELAVFFPPRRQYLGSKSSRGP